MDIGVDYKKLFNYDPQPLAQLLSNADDEVWTKNDVRQKLFAVHKNTKSIVYVWSNFSDVDYQNIETHIPQSSQDELHQEVWKIANQIKGCFGDTSTITKLMLAKLDGQSQITEHYDQGNLTKIHRCHLPVITNEDCLFLIDKVPYHFKPDFAFEFNNQKMHGVINNSNADRVHLICDILD